MSAQVSEHLVGWESVQNALVEIRANRGEFERFFSEVFDQLSTLSVELAERQQQWHSQRQRTEEELDRQKSRVEEDRAALTAQQEHARQTARDPSEQEIAAADENAGLVKRLQEELDEARQERAQLEQDQTMLESELESVRNRAAETAELLAEQKRQAAAQQAQWAEELKRMRCLLETVCGRLAEREAAPSIRRAEPDEPVAVAAPGKTVPVPADPALNSVMAQFQMLQRDVARRRAAVS